jgi:hypothetical protein
MKLSHWFSIGAMLLSSSTSLAADSTPIAASRFGISIDGVQVSVKAFEGGGVAAETSKPSTTPLKITIDRSGSDAMWQWVATSINQGPAPKKIEGQAKGKRRATFTGALIQEVKFPDLDAKDGKKHMDVTITVVPKRIAAAPDVKQTAPTAKQKSWNPANFRVKIGGLPVSRVSKIDSFTIKVKVVDGGKSPVWALENLRLTLDAAGSKMIKDTLAKDATKPLTIAFTDDDGSVWKTLSVSGLQIQTSTASKADGTITLKGSKILIN